jgi:hypothetical protein
MFYPRPQINNVFAKKTPSPAEVAIKLHKQVLERDKTIGDAKRIFL